MNAKGYIYSSQRSEAPGYFIVVGATFEKIKGRPQLSVEDAVSFVYHNLFWLKGNLNTEQKQDGKKPRI